MLFGKTILVTGVASGIGARTAELAGQMGADVIGVDVPRAGHAGAAPSSRATSRPQAGVADIVAQLPKRFDALANVAGLSGNTGVVPTLAVNFYGLRALSEAVAPRLREGGAIVNVASIAGFGWRANLERAKALIGIDGFPDVASIAAEHDLKDEEGYPLSKELLLLWTMRAAHQPLFKQRGIRVNAVSPGPVETPILKQFRAVLGDARVDSDIARVGRAGTAVRYRAGRAVPLLGRRALDQRRQYCRRWRPRSLDQRRGPRLLEMGVSYATGRHPMNDFGPLLIDGADRAASSGRTYRAHRSLHRQDSRPAPPPPAWPMSRPRSKPPRPRSRPGRRPGPASAARC